MAEKQNSTSNYRKGQGLVSALSERFKLRSSSESRMPSKAPSIPVASSSSVVTRLPPHPRNTTTTTQTSTGEPSSSKPPAVMGPKQFKKCKSATFQIDGHYYTIGLLHIMLYIISIVFIFCTFHLP